VVESFFATGSNATSKDLQDEIKSRASNLTEFLVHIRRTLHRHPELMYQEKETSRIVTKLLDELQIPYSTGWAVNTHTVIPGEGGYGIVVDIGTGKDPCILLRADIDALPILETTEGIESFKSRHDGKMHACGHDGHTAMLLGAAALLNDMKDSLNGTVRLMFQPAEEGGAGAKRMREEGVLDLGKNACRSFERSL
jgi:IAA-amino acid hydrolase